MLRVTPFANSLAGIAAGFFVLCRILVSVAPALFASIAQSWFHGLVVAPSPWPGMTAGDFVLGFVSVTVVAWLVAFAWATLYNRLAPATS